MDAAMIEHLDRLVSAETPSEDVAACAAGAEVVADLGKELLGEAPEFVVVDGRPHLRWRWEGATPIALIGHYDTVWPLGTLARWPFQVTGTTATGPGCFDMKAGIVQLFHAVAALGDPSGIEILLTCDEELGSQTSRHLVEEAARRASAALVFEASAAGQVKVGRKGTGMYRLEITGRAAHAGLEPEKGINALTELGHLLTVVGDTARPELGTTVTATLAGGGTVSNQVPASAWVELDVRVAQPGEAERVDEAIRSLAPTVPGAGIAVSGGPNRPPMPESAAADLHRLASELNVELGFGPLVGISVGGGSDGNFTAAVGCPTLDGLGAVGDGAHAEGEWVDLTAMPARTALVTRMITALRAAHRP